MVKKKPRGWIDHPYGKPKGSPHANRWKILDQWIGQGNNLNYRKIANNTVALRMADGSIGVRYHATIICQHYPNGDTAVRLCGWDSATTRGRLYSEMGGRYVGDKWVRNPFEIDYPKKANDYTFGYYHRDSKLTPIKVQKCRTCHGNGGHDVAEATYTDYWTGGTYDPKSTIKKVVPEHWSECYRCDGAGTQDYGSKRIRTDWDSHLPVRFTKNGRISTAPVVTIPINAPSEYATKHGYYSGTPLSMTFIPKSDTTASTGATVTRSLTTAIPALESIVRYPTGAKEPAILRSIIVDLNDNYKWSRERIADWVESLDLDLRFPVPADI